MASKRESSKLSKFDRGINSKVRDQDENNVDTKPKPSSNVLKNDDRPLQLKVEMTHLVISEEAKVKILDTLKFVNGEVSYCLTFVLLRFLSWNQNVIGLNYVNYISVGLMKNTMHWLKIISYPIGRGFFHFTLINDVFYIFHSYKHQIRILIESYLLNLLAFKDIYMRGYVISDD